MILIKRPFPNLTDENRQQVNDLISELEKIRLGDGGPENLDVIWPIISPKGNSTGLCSRNVLSIGGDRSSFYKQRWKNVYTLEEASVYLLDYYERCKHITKLGVLLTDVWRPSTLSRWSHVYEMYETIGIQSVALLYSGHQIIPIRWPWR